MWQLDCDTMQEHATKLVYIYIIYSCVQLISRAKEKNPNILRKAMYSKPIDKIRQALGSVSLAVVRVVVDRVVQTPGSKQRCNNRLKTRIQCTSVLHRVLVPTFCSSPNLLHWFWSGRSHGPSGDAENHTKKTVRTRNYMLFGLTSPKVTCMPVSTVMEPRIDYLPFGPHMTELQSPDRSRLTQVKPPLQWKHAELEEVRAFLIRERDAGRYSPVLPGLDR